MVRQLTIEQIYDIAKKYTFYSDLFNVIAGLISNIFIIFVLNNLRIFRNNQYAFYLKVESIVNIGLILTVFPSDIFSYILGVQLTFRSLIWCKLKAMLGQTFGLCSVYTICFSTFDQYLSTNHRYSFRQMSRFKLAHRLTYFNITFMSLHSLLFLIFTEIRSTFGCTVYNPTLKRYYSFFYYPVLNSGFPIITTILFSLLAYRNVRHLVRRQIPIVRRRLDLQMTAMVLARVICLITLGLPYITYTLYDLNLTITGNNSMEIAIATLVASISYSLMYTNFCITFYVFLFISSRFRRQVKCCLVKQCRHLLKFLTKSNRNQVAPEIDRQVVSHMQSSMCPRNQHCEKRN